MTKDNIKLMDNNGNLINKIQYKNCIAYYTTYKTNRPQIKKQNKIS